ncbi:interleukin-21-like isoform X2 [Betta splendens]|uniref:Interleukin-21 n=1 Tax=Betta splendens TaxID=158456 RepID=A0A6P7NPH0_BETSP|nr:interleukin-21-like isoform X2 [Betta splendens]
MRIKVCCSSLANTSTVLNQVRKLREVQKELNDVKDTVLKSDKMFNAPPQDIEDGCCLSALKCFRTNLEIDAAEKPQRKLYRSLRNPLTESALAFCTSENNSTCQSCDSLPKVSGREFFNRLESLIQMGLSNLSMN